MMHVGDRAEKIGGSYQATGEIRAVFLTRAGAQRAVFEFDSPPGLLHIFNPDQIRIVRAETLPNGMTDTVIHSSPGDVVYD